MDTTGLVLERALFSIPGILGILVALACLVGFIVKRDGGETLRLGLLVGVLLGAVLVGVSVIQARNALDASLPVNSHLDAPSSQLERARV